MPEDHSIVGAATGEPLPAGEVGIRLRFPLSGSPSRRWSRDLSARLTAELLGHRSVGHLRLNELVRGHEIVLDGVEAAEAPELAGAIERAVDATNQACADAHSAEVPEARQVEAEAIARTVGERQRSPGG